MSFPYLEQHPIDLLTIEEQRALHYRDFWDVGLSADDVYNGNYGRA